MYLPLNSDDRHRAVDRYLEQVPDLLDVLNEQGYEGGIGANVCVDPTTGGNLVAFSSGYGDGGDKVWFGLAADGRAVAVVTDFQVLDLGRGVHPWIESLRPGAP